MAGPATAHRTLADHVDALFTEDGYQPTYDAGGQAAFDALIGALQGATRDRVVNDPEIVRLRNAVAELDSVLAAHRAELAGAHGEAATVVRGLEGVVGAMAGALAALPDVVARLATTRATLEDAMGQMCDMMMRPRVRIPVRDGRGVIVAVRDEMAGG